MDLLEELQGSNEAHFFPASGEAASGLSGLCMTFVLSLRRQRETEHPIPLHFLLLSAVWRWFLQAKRVATEAQEGGFFSILWGWWFWLWWIFLVDFLGGLASAIREDIR